MERSPKDGDENFFGGQICPRTKISYTLLGCLSMNDLMESEYVVWRESVKRRAVDCALHISGLSYSGGESRDEDYEQGRGGGRELN
jgi:hypothetical protein